MKHLWALSSTLVLTTTLVVSGVAAGAAAPAAPSSDADRTPQLSRSTEARVAAARQPPLQAVRPRLLLAADHVPGRAGRLPPDVAGAGAAHAKANKDARGTRSDDQFFEISRTGSNDVPEAALRAYHHAEKVMATADPDCQISWTLLAAIGRVESNHGRFGGAQLGSDGVSRPEIRGPQLDGAGPFAAIHDSDNGALDHDKVWDRAVGQMQFLPETWGSVARDGDGDGKKNPDDIDDSALGSAVYLCGAGGSLADQPGMARAAFRYNHSDYYVQLVLSSSPATRPASSPCPRRRPPAEGRRPARPRSRRRSPPGRGTSPRPRRKARRGPRAEDAHDPKPSPPPSPRRSRRRSPGRSEPTPEPS